jgi:hypothetical protein
MRRQLAAGFVLLLPVVFGFSSCASTDKNEGLNKVDDLLNRVEQVQVEALVAREKASGAFDALSAIVAPDFRGDPMLAYTDLVKRIDDSKAQAKKLGMSVEPMKRTADTVFQSWTTDLEKFGNTNLRQQSQARLAETRSRYSAVQDSAVAALVSINAFNSDLSDQALFLQNDFNADAVKVIAAEVPGLTSQARDLGRRLNTCVNASKQYIAASALRGQIDAPNAPPAVASKSANTQATRRTPNAIDEGNAEQPAEGSANPNTAPARRRPRTGSEAPAAPEAPPAESSQPIGQGGTLPTSNVVKPLPVLGPQVPKPETDLSPLPAPVKPAGDGNR